MLTNNLNVSVGLVNGAKGKIKAFYIDKNDKCIGALVEFDNYSGELFEGQPKQVPILTIEKTEKNIRRRMLPLQLSFAMTIHKSQGLTLGNIDVYLENREFTPGLTFVAVSRVKSISNIRVHDMTRKRLETLFDDENIRKPDALLAKLKEVRRLNQLAEETVAKNNLR